MCIDHQLQSYNFSSPCPMEFRYFLNHRLNCSVSTNPVYKLKLKNRVLNKTLMKLSNLGDLFYKHCILDSYEVSMNEDNLLIEELNIAGDIYQIVNQIDSYQKEDFFKMMCELFHIVMFGTVKTHEDVICRDHLFTQLSEINDQSQYQIRFLDVYPNINQFVLCRSTVTDVVLTLGGGPVTICGTPKKYSRYQFVYFMRPLETWDENSIMKSHYTKEHLLEEQALEQVVQNFRIHYDYSNLWSSIGVNN